MHLTPREDCLKELPMIGLTGDSAQRKITQMWAPVVGTLGILCLIFLRLRFLSLQKKFYVEGRFKRPFSNSQFIEISNHKLHFRSWGSGEPLLLVHGICASTYIWRDIVEPLSKSFQVITLDLPGYGYSIPTQDFKPSLQEFSQIVTDFCNSQGFKKIRAAGSSMGGLILLDMIQKRPSFISHLVLISPSLKPRPVLFWASFAWPLSFLYWIYVQPELVQYIAKRIYTNQKAFHKSMVSEALTPYLLNYRAAKVAFQSLRIFSAGLQSLENTELPAPLVLWGKHDRVTRVSELEYFTRWKKPQRFLEIETCGHHPMEEVPEIIAQEIESYVTTSL